VVIRIANGAKSKEGEEPLFGNSVSVDDEFHKEEVQFKRHANGIGNNTRNQSENIENPNTKNDKSLDKYGVDTISWVFTRISHVMIFNLLLKVVDIVVLNPFQSKIVSCLAILDI